MATGWRRSVFPRTPQTPVTTPAVQADTQESPSRGATGPPRSKSKSRGTARAAAAHGRWRVAARTDHRVGCTGSPSAADDEARWVGRRRRRPRRVGCTPRCGCGSVVNEGAGSAGGSLLAWPPPDGGLDHRRQAKRTRCVLPGKVRCRGGRVALADNASAEIVKVRCDTSGISVRRCLEQAATEKTCGLPGRGHTKADYASMCLPPDITTTRDRTLHVVQSISKNKRWMCQENLNSKYSQSIIFKTLFSVTAARSCYNRNCCPLTYCKAAPSSVMRSICTHQFARAVPHVLFTGAPREH